MSDSGRPCGLEGEAGIEVRQVDGHELVVSSAALGWSGAELFSGSAGPCEISSDESPAAAHQLVRNRSDEPLALEVREGRGFRKVTLGPGQFWLGPADLPFLQRAPRGLSFTRLGLHPAVLDRYVGREDVRLRPEVGIEDPQLDLLFRALSGEVERGGPGGLAYSQSLLATLSHHLARHFSVTPARRDTVRGGLTPFQVRRVLELIDASLAEPPSLEQLAKSAGLSPYHFARQFKRSTGASPHRFVLARRLERARVLLERPDAEVGEVSLQVGFSDQSHFTRWFRRQFGVTPGQVRRRAS